eukprot:898278-Rhodomonas_salina.1
MVADVKYRVQAKGILVRVHTVGRLARMLLELGEQCLHLAQYLTFVGGLRPYVVPELQGHI